MSARPFQLCLGWFAFFVLIVLVVLVCYAGTQSSKTVYYQVNKSNNISEVIGPMSNQNSMKHKNKNESSSAASNTNTLQTKTLETILPPADIGCIKFGSKVFSDSKNLLGIISEDELGGQMMNLFERQTSTTNSHKCLNPNSPLRFSGLGVFKIFQLVDKNHSAATISLGDCFLQYKSTSQDIVLLVTIRLDIYPKEVQCFTFDTTTKTFSFCWALAHPLYSADTGVMKNIAAECFGLCVRVVESTNNYLNVPITYIFVSSTPAFVKDEYNTNTHMSSGIYWYKCENWQQPQLLSFIQDAKLQSIWSNFLTMPFAPEPSPVQGVCINSALPVAPSDKCEFCNVTKSPGFYENFTNQYNLSRFGSTFDVNVDNDAFVYLAVANQTNEDTYTINQDKIKSRCSPAGYVQVFQLDLSSKYQQFQQPSEVIDDDTSNFNKYVFKGRVWPSKDDMGIYKFFGYGLKLLDNGLLLVSPQYVDFNGSFTEQRFISLYSVNITDMPTDFDEFWKGSYVISNLVHQNKDISTNLPNQQIFTSPNNNYIVVNSCSYAKNSDVLGIFRYSTFKDSSSQLEATPSPKTISPDVVLGKADNSGGYVEQQYSLGYGQSVCFESSENDDNILAVGDPLYKGTGRVLIYEIVPSD